LGVSIDPESRYYNIDLIRDTTNQETIVKTLDKFADIEEMQ